MKESEFRKALNTEYPDFSQVKVIEYEGLFYICGRGKLFVIRPEDRERVEKLITGSQQP